MTEAGLIVLVASISPFRSARQFARNLMEPGEFIEIFVDAPLEECVKRDPKGLYKQVLSGEIAHFTGFGSAYEPLERPELHLRTTEAGPAELAEEIVAFLKGRLNGDKTPDEL